MISPENLEVWNNHIKGGKAWKWGGFCIFKVEKPYFTPPDTQVYGFDPRLTIF
jgi:hypothetical protein